MTQGSGVLSVILPNMRAAFSDVTQGMLAFRKVYLFLFAVVEANTVTYARSLLFPGIVDLLSVSARTPWGIVTSIFVHTSFSHYAYNMATLAFFTMLFTFCNSALSSSRNKLGVFFVASTLICAIISNILWVASRDGLSLGASGLVYAVVGNVLGFSLFNGFQVLNFKKLQVQRQLVVFIVLIDIVIAVLLLAQIVLNPQLFLNLGKGANTLAHGASFLLGMFAVYPLCLFKKFSLLQ